MKFLNFENFKKSYFSRFSALGAQQARVAGSTTATGMHAPPRGWPGVPRDGTPTAGWPARLPGIPCGSPEAGGMIGAAQEAARGAPGRQTKIGSHIGLFSTRSSRVA